MPLNTAIWLRASTPGEVVARSQINRFQANATLTELDSGALAEHGDAGEAEQGDHGEHRNATNGSAGVAENGLLDLLGNGLLGVALGVILLGGVGRLAVILLGVVGRSVLVHGVHCPVAGHDHVWIDRNVAVVGGEAPAGEDLALDGRCLDACGVGGELDVVLGVVADGLDQLVLGVVEGDRVQSLILYTLSYVGDLIAGCVQ